MSLNDLHDVIVNTHKLVKNNEKRPLPSKFPSVSHKYVYEVDQSHTERLLGVFNAVHMEDAASQPIATIANADLSSDTSVRVCDKRDRSIGSSLIFSCLNVTLHRACHIEALKYIHKVFFTPYVSNHGDVASQLIKYLIDNSLLPSNCRADRQHNSDSDKAPNPQCTFKVVASPNRMASSIISALTTGDRGVCISPAVFRPGEGSSTHQIHCV